MVSTEVERDMEVDIAMKWEMVLKPRSAHL